MLAILSQGTTGGWVGPRVSCTLWWRKKSHPYQELCASLHVYSRLCNSLSHLIPQKSNYHTQNILSQQFNQS